MRLGHGHGSLSQEMARRNYMVLGVNLILSLAIMYLGMFAMIDRLGDYFNNLNAFYMALVMWAPMAAVMLLTMRQMYPNRKLNLALYAALALIFALSYFGIRDQSLVGDRQFLRSMIPHHSGAILMCTEAPITDPAIKQLCQGIIASQTSEIAQMKAILQRQK